MMTFHNPPTEQQGIYRYDPTSIKTGGSAEIYRSGRRWNPALYCEENAG